MTRYERARHVACERCGATCGAMCTNLNTGRTRSAHVERIAAARRVAAEEAQGFIAMQSEAARRSDAAMQSEAARQSEDIGGCSTWNMKRRAGKLALLQAWRAENAMTRRRLGRGA